MSDGLGIWTPSPRILSNRFATMAARAQGPNPDYLGRRCFDLEDDKAMLKDFEMPDGTIGADMAGNGSRGFYNILFRT